MILLVCAGSMVAALRLGQAAEQAQRAERDTQQQLYDSLFVQAHANRSSHRPGQRLDSLKALAQAARLGHVLGRAPEDFLKLRNEAIACLALPDAELRHEWEGNPPGTSGVAVDARGERYAWSGTDGSIHIRRIADHAELLALPTLPAEIVSRFLLARFSPDGRFLALWYAQWARLHPLELWELKPGVSRPLLVVADVACEPEFSPDGRSIAVGLPDDTVRLFDLASGQESRRTTTSPTASRLAFHPDGHKLAVASTSQPRVQVYDLDSGRVLSTLEHPEGVQAVAWHPEGRLLATGCNDHRIYLWDMAGSGMAGQGKPELRGTQAGPGTPPAPRVLEGHTWEVHNLAFDAGGDWLVSFGWDMTLRLWDVATRRQLWQMEEVRVLGFHQGEQLLASCLAGRTVQLWALLPSEEFRVLGHFSSGVTGCELSPDSRWLVTMTLDSTSTLWDLERRREVSRLDGASSATFDRAGSLLLVTKKGQFVRRSLRIDREGTSEAVRKGVRPPQFATRNKDLRHGSKGSDPFSDNLSERPLLGPPEVLLSRSDGLEPGYIGWLSDDIIWFVHREPRPCVQVFTLRGAPKKRFECRIPNTVSTSLSSDGRWLAVGTHGGSSGLTILDVHTGEPVRTLPIGDAYCEFSPDSRWLVTATGRVPTPGGECCLWQTDTWEKMLSTPLRRNSSAPGNVSITPDGSLLVAASAVNEIRLMRLATLEEIARLEAPEAASIQMNRLSADGRYLAAAASNTIHLWDLHRLRRSLREIGLDWEPALGAAK
jgi:WD40 repeat protein